MDNNKVGKFIQKIRKQKGMTQKELGDKLHVTDKAVSKWERGLSFPDITMLDSLAEVLEVDTSEILKGEIGQKEKIDVQATIDEAINESNKVRKQRAKKVRKTIAMILFSIIIVIFLALIVITDYKKYHPNVIIEGENNYKLGKYNISQKGLVIFKDIISKSNKMTSKYTISYFETKLDKNGIIKTFTLSLNVFDEQENYIGRASYTYSNKTLFYTSPISDNLPIVISYDRNSDIDYLSEQIKKIPLKKQLSKTELKSYVMRYQPNTKIEEGTPIFDGRNDENFSILSKNEYNQGQGGISDGKTNVVIRLYDGTSIASGQQYLYVFTPIDDAVPNNPSNMMEADYYLNNGVLKFTRDYGENWIETDITKEELSETINFFRNGNVLKANSWFLSTNQNLPIAYFYGADPKLKISYDNGISWNTVEFNDFKEFGLTVPRRVVGFTTNNFGYVALATDWSMATGEIKKAYFTYDNGKNWVEKQLPLNNSRNTLIDMMMYDDKTGIVILNNTVDINFPLIYATNDGGNTWVEVKFSYSNLPDEITYFIDVDSIIYENNEYIITLGQGEEGTLKTIFRVNNLYNPWRFVSTTNQNIHKNG